MSKAFPIILIASLILIFGGVYIMSSRQPNPKNDNIDLSETEINISPSPTVTMARFDSLKFEDTVVGTGPAVKAGDTITVHYRGTLVNGDKFDSSYDRNQPFSTQIGVGRVIPGWDEGMIGMQVGGKRKLMIPAVMGYGAAGAPPSIPADSDLIFEVELLGIK